ncbi:AfsR/SARP family transcriptional regulator [Cryobacterium frigoriphilum]|uniref:AfsR/SARP family transcriptional regulator n=1 Tax=Cryobacterium frigoriphilum TaxID=1259150 RepID=UPI00141A7198|nr:bacterial transcriptional activator domain-containing protein [Cryobacterium frigoriphilum]
MLGCWQLRRNEQAVEVGARQKRLISALALLGARSRHVVAGLLWPDSSEVQAAGNLRASLFRIAHDLPALVRPCDPLQLEPTVIVDLHAVRHLIDEITDAAARPAAHLAVPGDAAEVLRAADLLPGWYEDWVLREQDRLQQQRIEALEALARHHLRHSDLGPAIGAARAATAIDPLRESAQLILVRGHLAEDNHASALRAYREFRRSLGSELGVEPSPRFAELLGNDLHASDRSASDLMPLPR